MSESETPKPHHQRWRTGDVVAMGLAAALVVGSAGTGLFVASRAIESQSAQTSSTTQTDTTATTQDSTAPDSTTQDISGGQSFGGPAGGYGGGQTGTSESTTTTLETTAATDEQSAGVVVIDTVLDYESAAAAGTGLILTSDGRILTNNHVVEGATSITVTVVSTGVEYTAEVVGTDATDDIAVLELVDASGLTVADLDTTGDVAVGDAVTGVGNAGGTGDLTAAAGTVLSLEQSITAQDSDGSDAEDLTGLIEVDADIESGESGGPLYDADGEVIGIDTAASSGTTNITGYAIPIEDALEIVDAIDAAVATGVDTDTITVGYPAFLGIGLGAASGTTASSTDAALVAGVIADTPAESIGLAAGDTIIAVDGIAVATATALSAALAGYNPGDTVTIDWVDAAGAAHSASATLIAGPVG
ncbi:trypsin-like peptidase domain-containing protein [Cryobacterium sp. SO2]|uniref:S1C family serine protease n=1 Tax=Cryobacterium sp. SO2 TaxID=1897060 RepID=UPI00223D3F5A|nr:trypsin-like peptidase domain-containing protein [Cryobacterium sp. SO2]WEO76278.1 trypsin-like peptidase domain-containing protein [Cryobacterium sp. SO2]